MADMALAAFAGLSAALPAASTVATVLQGVATVGSVLMNMQASSQAAMAGQAQAQEERFQGDLARLESDRQVTESAARALELRRDALRKIGAARVAFGASGLDISSNQLGAAEGEIEGEAAYGLSIEKTNQKIAETEGALRQGQYVSRAANAVASGQAKSRASLVEAGVTGAKGLLSIVKRG